MASSRLRRRDDIHLLRQRDNANYILLRTDPPGVGGGTPYGKLLTRQDWVRFKRKDAEEKAILAKFIAAEREFAKRLLDESGLSELLDKYNG